MKKATREALGAEILKLGMEHDDVFVVDCDVAKSCKTLDFAEKLPKQHINVGISEQNAMGIAAGLATAGKIPALCHRLFVVGVSPCQIATFSIKETPFPLPESR